MTPEEFHKHIHRIIPSGMDLSLNGIVFDLGLYIEPEETRRFVSNGDTIWGIINCDRTYKFLYCDNTVTLISLCTKEKQYIDHYTMDYLQNMDTFEAQKRFDGELEIFIRYVYKRYIDIVNDSNFVF